MGPWVAKEFADSFVFFSGVVMASVFGGSSLLLGGQNSIELTT